MTGFVTPALNAKLDKTSKWKPKISKYTNQFLNSLNIDEFPPKAKDKLFEETFRILSSCHDPSSTNLESTTGLVVGRVQSGKTTSFKTLSMLAVDNNFKLIILFAGRTNNLINQNRDEFDKLSNSIELPFLVFGSTNGPKSWIENMAGYLKETKDIGPLKGKPVILIINKHAGHINAIAKALKRERLGLFNINTLIIDDEADNASLNASKDKDKDFEATAIYKSIKRLRKALPKHSVVQYTATPQSLLLISKKDHYSPEWARVITPGKNYIGASDLFNKSSLFYEEVPEEETASPKNISDLELPESFKSAFRSYLIASAQHAFENRFSRNNFHKNSTLMVHPHIYKVTHDHWQRLINDFRDIWVQDIEDNQEMFLKQNKETFLKDYKEIKKSVNRSNGEIADFKDLYENYVPAIIQKLKITKVNHDASGMDWGLDYNVLIGGMMLDRGYVVKGLVTTYMPRGKGGGMIDSLQQRGRFYGYKRSHIGFIKAWMTQSTIDAYKSYAKHERHLYKTLEKLSEEGRDLRTWERKLLLDSGLKACRKNVISIGLKDDYLSQGWYFPRFPSPGDENNENIFNAIINHYKEDFKPFQINDVDTTEWTPSRSAMDIREVNLSRLLGALREYDPGELDEGRFAKAKIALSNYADMGYSANIVLTGTKYPDLKRYTHRERPSIQFPDSPLKSSSLFQGMQKSGSFPGERNLIPKVEDSITIHLTKLTTGANKKPSFILLIKFPKYSFVL